MRCEEKSGNNDGGGGSGERVRMSEYSEYRELTVGAAEEIRASSALNKAASV